MAKLIRNYKSGSDWTENDLTAYNIKVENNSDDLDFFGHTISSASLDDIPQSILEGTTVDADDEGYDFMTYLDMAMQREESAVDDFMMELMRMLGYRGKGRIIRARKNINLFMCGHYTHAKTNVCVMDRDRILQLVQSHFPEPQLIAGAIAAFQHNNRKREVDLGKEPLERCTFPGITMVGTTPLFYKITITRALNDAVRLGEYPLETTVVQRFNPLLAHTDMSMVSISNRVRVLRCFKLFRDVMLACAHENDLF